MPAAAAGALLALVLLACGAAAEGAEWPMLLQDPAHRALLGRGLALPPAAPTERWRYEQQGEIESSAVVGGGLVFAAGGRDVFAVDQRTGKRRWRFKAKKAVLGSGALGGGLYFVGADDRSFYALDQKTGELRWEAATGGEFTGGATVDEREGVVYVGSGLGGRGTLHAFHFNGTKRFDFAAKGNVASTPALDASGVYFGDDSGRLYKVDRASGRELWRKKFHHNIRCPPTLESDSIFITSGDPDGSRSGEVVRLAPDGSVVWSSDCGVEGSKCESCWTSPAVVGDVVIAACGLDSRGTGTVWGLEKASGAVRWRFAAGNDCQTSSPVVVGDAVVLGCIDGKLYALAAADGALRWSWSAGAGIWATPALDGAGTIYVGSHDGCLYALGGAPLREDL